MRPAVDGQCTTPQRGTSLVIYAVVVAAFLLVGFIAHASFSSLSRRVSDHDKTKAYRQQSSMSEPRDVQRCANQHFFQVRCNTHVLGALGTEGDKLVSSSVHVLNKILKTECDATNARN